MLGVRLSSYGCTREVGRAREKRLSGTRRSRVSASLASRVLSQLPKCIHNSIDAQIKYGPFLLEHCHFKRKLIKYRILLNHFERFDLLNAITRFDARSRHIKSARKIASYVLTRYRKPTTTAERNVIGAPLVFLHVFQYLC